MFHNSALAHAFAQLLYEHLNVVHILIMSDFDIEAGRGFLVRPRNSLRNRLYNLTMLILSPVLSRLHCACAPVCCVLRYVYKKEGNDCCYKLGKYLIHCLITYCIGCLVGFTLHQIYGSKNISAAIASAIIHA